MVSKHKKFVKGLIALSMDEKSRISEPKVQDILNSLMDSRPNGLKSILRLFLKEVQKHENKYHAVAEIGCKEDQSIQATLKNKIQSMSLNDFELTVIENTNLISGCRIRLGDDVFEDSLQTSLLRLSKSFI